MPQKRTQRKAKTSRSISAAVGLTIRELRTEQGISQDALAESSHVHRNYIGRIERGTLNPSLDSLARVARDLGLPLSELIARAEKLT